MRKLRLSAGFLPLALLAGCVTDFGYVAKLDMAWKFVNRLDSSVPEEQREDVTCDLAEKGVSLYWVFRPGKAPQERAIRVMFYEDWSVDVWQWDLPPPPPHETRPVP